MSLRIMVVPEDPTYDQYILKPLVTAILRDLHRPGHVEVLRNPHLRGVDQAIAKLPSVVRRYPQYGIFLLMLDRDGDPEGTRQRRVRRVEEDAATDTQTVIGCLAVEEVETWCLAAQWRRCRREFPAWSWAEVRGEVHVKERYFAPFLDRCGDPRVPGRGRSGFVAEADLGALIEKCDELATLRERLRSAAA